VILLVSRWLRKYPTLRNVIKYSIYFIVLLFPLRKVKFNGKIIDVFPSLDGDIFFGYFDKNPYNKTGEYVIAHRVKRASLKPLTSKCDIIVKNILTDTCEAVASTDCWNYQQGARLMWIDETRFIFNSIDSDGCLGSSVYNVVDGYVVIRYPAIYELGTKGHFFINFSTLEQGDSAYSYPVGSQPELNGDIAIFFFSWETGTTETIISIDDLGEYGGEKFLFSCDEKRSLTHLLFNESHRVLVFVQRAYYNSERRDVLWFYDFNNLSLVALKGTNFVSHFCWCDDKLLCYMSHMEYGEGWFFIKKDLSVLKVDALSVYSDGHPTAVGSTTVLDSYPDFFGYKKLMLMKNRNVQIIAKLRTRNGFHGTSRCDLHPRLLQAQEGVVRVSIDSEHSGFRRLYELDYMI
jgi:hypothetical protein